MSEDSRSPKSPPEGVVFATVIGRWDDERVLLQTAGGDSISVSVPEGVKAGVDVGQNVRVEFGPEGTVRDWQPIDG